MSLKLGSSNTVLMAGGSAVKQMLLGTSPKFAAPILDHVPNAAAAYSLRRLSNTFTGPVVKVRRSSDSTLADFTADEVVDGTLAAWCGAGDGLVHTWYDQSGNERNATQATAGYQPKLVSSGVVVTEGGKAAVKFDGVDDRLKSAFSLSSRLCVFGAANYHSTGTGGFVLDGYGPSPNACSIWAYSATQLRFVYPYDATARLRYRPFTTTSQFLFSITNTSDAVSDAFVNSSNVETLAGGLGSLVSMGGLTLGSAASDTGPMLGTISEVLVYESDVSASRELAEGEMAWHYGLQAKLPHDHPYAPQSIGGGSQRVPTDEDAIAYLEAVAAADGAPVENGVALAINDFVVGLKATSAGIAADPTRTLWDAVQASCIMCGARTISGALVPLKGTAPTPNNLVNFDYTRTGGIEGDGSSTYLDSNRSNDADGQDDRHIATYSSETSGDGVPIGTPAGETGRTAIFRSAAASSNAFRLSSNTVSFYGANTATGLFGASRSQSDSHVVRLSQENFTPAVASESPSSSPLLVFAAEPLDPAGFCDDRIAFYSIGSALDLAALDTKVTALVAAVSAALA